MLKRVAGKKLRAKIQHENNKLGKGAGVTEGHIALPGHNAFQGEHRTTGASGPAPVPRASAEHAAAGSAYQAQAYTGAPQRVPPGPGSGPEVHAQPHAQAYQGHAQEQAYQPQYHGTPQGHYEGGQPAPSQGGPYQGQYQGGQYQGQYQGGQYHGQSQGGQESQSQGGQYQAQPQGSQLYAGSSGQSAQPQGATYQGQTQGATAYQGQPQGGPAYQSQPPGRPSVDEQPQSRPSYDAAAYEARAQTPTPASLPPPGHGAASLAQGPSPAAPASPAKPAWARADYAHDTRASTSSAAGAAPAPAYVLPEIPVARLSLDHGDTAAAAPFNPVISSLTHERQPAALDAVLSALTAAGRTRQTARILRSGQGHDERRVSTYIMTPQPSRDVETYVNPSDEPQYRRLNAVLSKLRAEWPFLLDDKFDPLTLALSLLPQGTLRARLDEFASLDALMEGTLQGTLDDHYDSFAMTITVNHGMMHSLGDAQSQISRARAKLQSARDALGARRADLVQMWQRNQTVQESMRVLALIDQLRNVPNELETLLSEKQFLRATDLLVHSLRTIQRDELAGVGAMADLRTYLRSQEHALLEILIEEMHHHIYLTSFYCDERWKKYTPGQEALPDVVFGADYASDIPGDGRPTKLARFLHHLHGRVGYPQETIDAADPRASSNPEQDSFLYLEMLLESLARLGKIGYALEMVGQRLPFEVHHLVDTTIDEVDRRHDAHRPAPSGATAASVFFASSALSAPFAEGRSQRKSFSQLGEALRRGQNRAEVSALHRDMETMRDFFWTLFSKFDAMLQAHRVIQDVTRAILGRTEAKEATAADRASVELGVAALARVWQTVEHEVHALLYDYLSEDSHAAADAESSVPSVNQVLRAGRYDRDKSQLLFRMADVRKNQHAVRASESTVDEALHAFVPGLVVQESGVGLQPVVHGAQREEYTGAGHRLLVRPLTFTVSVLFQPTLAFIARVEQVLPADAAGAASHGFGGFLREFMQLRFLPVLQEKVQSLTATATDAPEAFAPDPSAKAARPVARSAAQVVALVDSLYTMLQVAPFHRASYARLILVVFVEYYDRCNRRFKQLVSEEVDAVPATGPYVRAALWVQRPPLYTVLAALIRTPEPGLYEDEARMEQAYAAEAPIERADLITSRKRIAALGHLHYSMQWILDHIRQLRVTTADAPASDETLALPLDPALAGQFDEIPRLFARLADVVQMTLHVEVRLKTLYNLQRAVTHGEYVVDATSLEPDRHVVDLNTELGLCHDVFKDTVLEADHAYILDGLDRLMDAIMVDAVLHVRAVNRHGVTKMIRNILSLQQNLKNMVAAPQRIHLEKSKHLWEMLNLEPEVWMSTLPKGEAPYTFDVYKAALDLCLGLDRSERPVPGAPLPRIAYAGTTAEAGVAQKRYNELLIELHERVGSAL